MRQKLWKKEDFVQSVPKENYFKSGEKSFKISCQPDMFSVILIYELNKKVLTKKEKKNKAPFLVRKLHARFTSKRKTEESREID